MLRSIAALAVSAALAVAVGAEPSVVWLDVPFVKQEKNGCGAASAAMLTQYWRLSAHPQALLEQASELQRYLESAGLQTFVFRGNWTDLQENLSAGRPLIACVKPGNRLHYVVVAGLDSGRDLVLVNDPAVRKLIKVNRATFEKQWSATDHWTLLGVPRQGG